MFSIKRLKEIINLLPAKANPRIGGSCALYFYGEVESYRDVDIIVDSKLIYHISFILEYLNYHLNQL